MNNPKGRVSGATFQSMQSLILVFLGALSSFSLVTGGEDEVFLPLLHCVWEQKNKDAQITAQNMFTSQQHAAGI